MSETNYAKATDIGKLNRPFVGNNETEVINNEDGTTETNIKFQRGVVYETNEEGYAVPIHNAEGLLRHEEWQKLDDAIIEEKATKVTLQDWFITNGLTYTLDNALGTTELGYEVVSDMHEASVDMEGIGVTENDTVSFDKRYMPTPLIYKDFTISSRKLASSRTKGESLATTQTRLSARKVREKVEDLCIEGSFVFGSGTLQGLTTFDYRMTGGTGENKWTKTGKTGEQIYLDVEAMIDQAIAKEFTGPYVLFINRKYNQILNRDYSTAYKGLTIRERLLMIDGLDEIKVIDRFGDDITVLMQKTSDVGEVVLGIPLTVVQEDTNKGFLYNFRVLEMTIPRFFATKAGAAGIVHWTFTDA